MQLTTRQQEVLQYIQSDPSLTLREIADEVGVTRERVRQILAKLTKKGVIEDRLVLKKAAIQAKKTVEQEQIAEKVQVRRYRKRIWHRMAYVGKRLRLRHAAGLDRFGMNRDCHMPGEEAMCQFTGCDRPVDARGFCALHYGRLRYTGSLWVCRRSRRSCKEDGCRMPTYARNMCHNHYSVYIRKNPAGTGLRSHNTSGYRGVSRSYNKWQAYIRVPGKGHTSLGCFDSKEMAARAYDTAARKYIGDTAKLNFPNENIEVVKEQRGQPLGVSGYRGIEWHTTKKRWIVRIYREGERIYIGRFIDLEEAAHAQDSAAMHYLGSAAQLNFPNDPVVPFESLGKPACYKKTNGQVEKRRPGGSSQYRGVTKKKSRWESRIEVERQRIRLGSFADEESAARAYDAAAFKYFGDRAILNFPDHVSV